MGRAVLDLDRKVPERARTILASLPGVSTRVTGGPSQLRVGKDTYPLALVAGGLRPLAQATAPMLASLAGRGGLGFAVADRLAEHVRRELEEAGCAYADGTGAAHIDVPGFFLHIQGKPPRSLTSVPGPPGIGVTGVRAIQVLLTDAERHWSVADLEREAACSRGEAHRVVTRLEREGFLEAHGRARTLRRVVADPGGLLDWLSTVPSARRIRERLHASAYATSPAALVTTISLHASKADLVYAVTGAAAAHVYGVTATTSVSVTMIRVAPDVPLLNACSVLQAEPADRGANIMLVRDFGMVGVHARQFCGPPSVASPVRVSLDMLDEPRGDDAAALFREAVIGW